MIFAFPKPAQLSGEDLADQVAAAGLPRPLVLLRGQQLNLVFDGDLTAQQQTQVAAVVAAHTIPAPTPEQKVERVGLPPRVQAALTLRASASWADMTAGEKARVQAILDGAGAALLAALRS